MSDTQATALPQQARRVVVVEDDDAFRAGLQRSLRLAGYEVCSFGDAESALAHLAGEPADAVLTDLRLPGADGLSLLQQSLQDDPQRPVILMTGHGDVATAVQAMRKGAFDFLEKPYGLDRLLALIGRAVEQYRLVAENRSLKQQLASGIEQVLVGQSRPMQALRELVLRLAPMPADVLLTGETGTGKELVARCLHDFSGRKGPFVAVNCAAVPESLFESELFGHEAGAFSGALKQRVGKFEHADGGTLFLDEIEAMPLALQAKVLRVLQEREVERLGGNKPMKVDFRVVTASKVELEEEAQQGRFRPDLFYRLNVAALRVPPLRERIDDVLPLFAAFQQQASLRFGMPDAAPPPALAQQLVASDWPGNVRQLKACAERHVLGLPVFDAQQGHTPARRTLAESVAIVERSLVEDALRRNQGVVKAAGAELGLSAATLYRKLKTLGIDSAALKVAGETDCEA